MQYTSKYRCCQSTCLHRFTSNDTSNTVSVGIYAQSTKIIKGLSNRAIHQSTCLVCFTSMITCLGRTTATIIAWDTNKMGRILFPRWPHLRSLPGRCRLLPADLELHLAHRSKVPVVFLAHRLRQKANKTINRTRGIIVRTSADLSALVPSPRFNNIDLTKQYGRIPPPPERKNKSGNAGGPPESLSTYAVHTRGAVWPPPADASAAPPDNAKKKKNAIDVSTSASTTSFP